MKNLVKILLFLCVAFIFAAQTPPSGKHKIKKIKTNTAHSDYAVTFLPNDKVVFVNPIQNTEHSSLDFFIGDISKDGEINNKKPLNGVSQNSRISKTGITFSSDYKKVYFSARGYKKNSRRKLMDRIFIADVNSEGNWTNIKKAPFNNEKYISKNPVLSKDGKKLYFVSNRKPSIGGLDIFVININDDGTYSEAVNLGKTINTKGDEVTPFVSDKNVFYFSSDGREDSYGGLDVYAVDIVDGSLLETPIHLDASINRAHDEFSYIIKNDIGYFSSNDKNNINIFSFNVEQEVKEDLIVDAEKTTEDQTIAVNETKQSNSTANSITDFKTEKEARLKAKQERAEASKEAIRSQKEKANKEALSEKRKQQAENEARIAEQESQRQNEIEEKNRKVAAQQESLKAQQAEEEKVRQAERTAQQEENEAKIAALESQRKANVEAKKRETLAQQESLKAQQAEEEREALAQRNAQQAENKAKVAALKSQKQAEILRKKQQAIDRQQQIEEAKAAKKAQVIADKQATKEVNLVQHNESNKLADVSINNLNQSKENISTTEIAVVKTENDEPTSQPESKYHIKYLEANTSKSDYAVGYYNDKVVFVTPIDAESKKDNSDLYIGSINEGSEIVNKKGLNGIARSKKISKTGVAFSRDSKTVYFSAKKNKKKAKDQLFSATIDARGNWTNVKKLPFNDKKYTTGQPTISADGKKLYFVSDRPGSFGSGTDIYVVNITDKGTYSNPVNLGTTINTRGNEVTPFITDDNVLYFSSDGHPDSQGLDVYSSQLIDNSASELKHLDAPINGINNDFAFIKNNDKGYFSSNRLQGQDNNDIYSFISVEEKPKKCLQEIAGVVKDKETLGFLKGAALTLFDDEGNQLKQVFTDSEGNYKLTLDCNKTYTLIASNSQYTKEEHIVNTANYLDAPALEANKLLVKKQEGEPEDVIAVTKVVKDTDDTTEVEETNVKETTEVVKTETEATKTGATEASTDEVLNLSSVSVYYDFDSSEIRYDDTDELDRITTMMKANANVKIQVNAYTDARGSSSYNLALSIRRANAAINYIVSKGIQRNRLRAKGFGESQMVNHCVNNVECSEAAHQMNRRTEFVILN